MIREIINIDEEKCDGCGLCIPACHEGAIQLIDGKARLISDLFCDGLGACIGHCPQGAITIEKREAEPYDEIKVMDIMITKPDNVIKAHLQHLKDHNETVFLNQALEYLNKVGRKIEWQNQKINSQHSACPGSRMIDLNVIKQQYTNKPISNSENQSMLQQWPIQLHLINPSASCFKNKELVIMSDCAPLASANIHKDYLANRSVVIACPKLDDTKPYLEKLEAIYELGNVPKAIIVRMEVPCCGGLTKLAYLAKINSNSNIILEEHTLSINGDLIKQEIL